MTTISDRLLAQYLAGALEPPARQRVEAHLAAHPEDRARLAALEARVSPTPTRDEPAWFLPPPSLPSRLGAAVAPVGVMDASRTGWLTLRLDVEPALHDHLVVVLERPGATWNVVFPTSEAQRIQVHALPRDGNRPRLDLAAGVPRRVAVVLVPPTVTVNFDLPPEMRWAEVQRGLLTHRWPTVSFDTP